MDTLEKYWEEIARLIAESSGGDHPANWNKFKIDAFLQDFNRRLEVLCQDDPRKAALCGIAGVKGNGIQNPGISYFSFRRIFITRESTGNKSTREMFAIYLGFDSMNDFMAQKNIPVYSKPEKSVPRNEAAVSFKDQGRIRIFAPLVLGVLTLFALLYKGNFCNPAEASPDDANQFSETDYLFVKNEKGIALIDLQQKTTTLLLETSDVIGIDFDPRTNELFWANSNENYRCLSKVRLSNDLKSTEPGSLRGRFTEKMGLPVGIALDSRNRIIYCADYLNPCINTYDYQGHLLTRCLGGPISGKPSSVELDIANQILYWTDLKNSKIGRIWLSTGKQEPDFIPNAGPYPDGLSLDTTRNRLYWACNRGNKIGWANVTAPSPHFISISETPSAVEVDPGYSILYMTDWGGNQVLTFRLNGQDSLSAIPDHGRVFEAGGLSPGVIKLFRKEMEKSEPDYKTVQ